MLDLIVWLGKLVPAFSLLVYSFFNILFKKEVGVRFLGYNKDC